MGRNTLKKFTAFLLVLAITICLVAVLSAASRVSPDEAVNRYVQQLQSEPQEPQGIFAPAVGEPGVSLLAGTAGFLVLLAIPVVGLMVFAWSSRKGRTKGARERRQSYRPRNDMALRGSLGAKYHRV